MKYLCSEYPHVLKFFVSSSLMTKAHHPPPPIGKTTASKMNFLDTKRNSAPWRVFLAKLLIRRILKTMHPRGRLRSGNDGTFLFYQVSLLLLLYSFKTVSFGSYFEHKSPCADHEYTGFSFNSLVTNLFWEMRFFI